MNEWKSFQINKNLIETETAKAVLVKMPHSGKYDGWKFWHPRKCVHNGANSAALRLSYTDEFKFRVFKQMDKKPFSKLAEKHLTPDELFKEFETVNDNIIRPVVNESTTIEVREAPVIKIDNVEIPEDLRND